MSACRYQLVDINPNDVTGGKGCLCSEMENPDTEGPYFVFPGNDMENPLSPHAVLCAGCVRGAFADLDEEVLSGGENMSFQPDEPETIDSDAEEIPDL